MLLISGPINTIRLEGSVFGVKKVLYIFVSYNENYMFQTECPDHKGTKITKYIAKNIHNAKGTLDFFIPTIKANLQIPKDIEFRGQKTYLDEVIELFATEFAYERSDNKDKILPAKSNSNVRLHYIEFINEYQEQATYSLNIIIDNINKLSEYTDFTMILNEIDAVEQTIIGFIDLFFDKKIDINYASIVYYANKFNNKYKHPAIYEKMGKLLMTLKQNFQNILVTVRKLKQEITFGQLNTEDKPVKVLDQKTKNYMYTPYKYDYTDYRHKVLDILATIENDLYDNFSHIHNLFFLRRFLDKDYITNAITYISYRSSAQYMQFLVNEFDFKVTHYYYSPAKSPADLTKKIKKYKSYTDSYKIQDLIMLGQLFQCSFLVNFPENFQ